MLWLTTAKGLVLELLVLLYQLVGVMVVPGLAPRTPVNVAAGTLITRTLAPPPLLKADRSGGNTEPWGLRRGHQLSGGVGNYLSVSLVER